MTTPIDFQIPIQTAHATHPTEEMKLVARKVSTLLIDFRFSPTRYDNHLTINCKTAQLEAAFVHYADTQEPGVYSEVRENVWILFTQHLADAAFIEKYANLLGYTLDYITCIDDHVLISPNFPTNSMPLYYETSLRNIRDELNSRAILPPVAIEKPTGIEITWKIPEKFLKGIKLLQLAG
ncbi:MAG TPA: hypothetical protein VIJ14_05495 [Rhabdochlamydiaceae bacterium]